MQTINHISNLSKLGLFLGQFSTENFVHKDLFKENELFYEPFSMLVKRAVSYNSWFTTKQISNACASWSEQLNISNLERWLSAYQFNNVIPKQIAIIMAGNIPMVGLHDFLCGLVSGHKMEIKLSSNDPHMIPMLARLLYTIEPAYKEQIKFTEEKLTHFDAVIATGSNNTSRYFEHYFGKKPHIIRKNRNSIAVLDGNESEEDLTALGKDIFTYYGLGCRSISKIYVPKDYDFDLLFKAIYPFKDIINDIKYANNYDYNKAIYLMSLYDIVENGFLMLKEDKGLASPIATLFYEKYEDISQLGEQIKGLTDEIQCISSNLDLLGSLPFGNTQNPQLWNYADNVDTIKFLLNV